MRIAPYQSDDSFDEMFAPDGQPRPCGSQFVERLQTLSDGNLQQRQKAADLCLQNMGITFNVYGHEAGTEKVWPFDLLPRIIDSQEWQIVESGLRQRIQALNLFVDDIYNDCKIIKDGAIPEELVQTSKTLRPECKGFHPPKGLVSYYRRRFDS